MSHYYPYLKGLRLHVEGRIAPEDAERQEQTAREILRRLKDQPGVVLADEVGMGKTFVALAVAVSVALNNHGRRPVAVMVPPSLKEKWPSDFDIFRERCLPKELRDEVRCGTADRAEEFLKLLDDPPERRKAVIFVTHGALSRGLTDSWIMLALIYQALLRRKNVEAHRRDLSRVLGRLLWMGWVERQGQDIWLDLLRTRPDGWLAILRARGIDPERDNRPDTDDDPVPAIVAKVLPHLDTTGINAALKEIPRRMSGSWDERLTEARGRIKMELRGLWQGCLHEVRLRLPLLILDEAHHLKNPKTRLASLFEDPEAEKDAEAISPRGLLEGAFERMLFLTATPFQLGHGELCSVLERFRNVAWKGVHVPVMGLPEYQAQLKALRGALDDAQAAAVALDAAWGRLTKDDLTADDRPYRSVQEWWPAVGAAQSPTPRAAEAIRAFRRAQEKLRAAEILLSPWVIRHLKSRLLQTKDAIIERRRKLPGLGICHGYEKDDHKTAETDCSTCPCTATRPGPMSAGQSGIPVIGEALLPFLLAARASAQNPETRPVFAEGLASSYEAFLETRLRRAATDEDESDHQRPGEAQESAVTADQEARWYLGQLEKLIPRDDLQHSKAHPKVRATVCRVRQLWRQNEKVLVFCHWVVTGKVLRREISKALEEEIARLGAIKLRTTPRKALETLDRIGKRFFDEDSPIRRACDREIADVLDHYPQLDAYRGGLIEAVRRNIRTPSSLARHFPLDDESLTEAHLNAFFHTGGAGFKRMLDEFFRFLVERCGPEETGRYINAINDVQTGRLRVEGTLSEDEAQGEASERLMANVRLVNGATKQETRQRLMLTFNTPFYPEVLVASSVMAEGVDLHLNCRHVIHHDLCWNPSTLEQRTGRVDRIGAKAERVGQPIEIFLPYVAETQDEKMYRVVMDRERWFNIVMGETYTPDYQTTERLAARIPFPETAAEELRFRLEVSEHA